MVNAKMEEEEAQKTSLILVASHTLDPLLRLLA